MRTVVVLCAILPSLAMADVDSQFGLGLGTQYGGFAGFKYSMSLNTNKIYVGAGLAGPTGDRDDVYGVTLGWEKAITDKHALGLFVRTKKRENGDGVYLDYSTSPPDIVSMNKRYESFIGGSYTYYFGKSSEAGFLTGLSAGKTYENTNVKKEFESGIQYGLHFGYQF
ncbi:hypothetical protein [Microbulbifer magnicolonia]|uniref:hypothetical protein n=1 Tax=Microbulbifer magnicolonia TaxID=3109744 RepID=UPI002B40C1A3|nr:hypothetical protein [Microbulbifer sp. GG15]